MKIFITNSLGKHISLDVQPTTTVESIIRHIYKNTAQLEVPSLYLEGEDGVTLDPGKTLKDYAIDEKSILKSSPILQPEIPEELFCPLSGSIFFNPVILPCGTTVEREVIEKWINEKGQSPFTKKPLKVNELKSDLAILQKVNNFFESHKTMPYIDLIKDLRQYQIQGGQLYASHQNQGSVNPSTDDLLAMQNAISPVIHPLYGQFLPFFSHPDLPLNVSIPQRQRLSQVRRRKLQLLLENNAISEEQAIALTVDQMIILEQQSIQRLIVANRLTVEAAISINLMKSFKLCSPKIFLLVLNNQITVQQALDLNTGLEMLLVQPDLAPFMAHQALTFDDLLRLSQNQALNLVLSAIRELVTLEIISLERAIQLTDEERWNLVSQPVQEFVREGALNWERAIVLTQYQRKVINVSEIRKIMASNNLCLEDLLALTPPQSISLCDQRIRPFLRTGLLSYNQAINLNESQRKHLADPIIHEAIEMNQLIVDEVISMSWMQVKALKETIVYRQSSCTHP